MTPENNEVCEKIKNIREKRNMSQKSFGKKIGLSAKTISSYETKRTIPPLRVLEHISQTYNVSFTQLSKKDGKKLEIKITQIRLALDELDEILLR